MTFYIFLQYFVPFVTQIVEFLFQRIARVILYKALGKELFEQLIVESYPINTAILQNGALSIHSFSYERLCVAVFIPFKETQYAL